MLQLHFVRRKIQTLYSTQRKLQEKCVYKNSMCLFPFEKQKKKKSNLKDIIKKIVCTLHVHITKNINANDVLEKNVYTKND